MPNRHLASAKRISTFERQKQALELRKYGLTYQEIADQLGYKSPSGAEKAVHSIMRKYVKEPIEAVLRLEIDRLDMWLSAIAAQIQRGDLQAIDRGLRIQERRAKYLGLDAPTKIASTTPDGSASAPVKLYISISPNDWNTDTPLEGPEKASAESGV